MSTYKDSLLGAIRKLCTQLNGKFAKSSDMINVIGLLNAYRRDLKKCVKKDDLYPVGSIITSYFAITSASLYGGTWEAGAYAHYQWGSPVFKAGATPASGEPYVYKRIK